MKNNQPQFKPIKRPTRYHAYVVIFSTIAAFLCGCVMGFVMAFQTVL